MKVGDARVSPVIEIDAVPFPVAHAFEDIEPALIAANRDWLMPDHLSDDGAFALMSHHAWLVEIGGHRILIDPCVGNGRDRVIPAYDQLDTDWLDVLARAGAAPEDIDIVLCTHLHVDHVGWNTRRVDGRWVPTFPNARYVFSRAEAEFWSRELDGTLPTWALFNSNVYADSVQPVIDAGQAWIVDAPIAIHPALQLVATPGHTPGHVGALLDAGNDGVVFCGDTIHSPLQLADPGLQSRGYVDAAAALSSRLAMLDAAADRGWHLAPAHFRKDHTCRVRRTATGYRHDWSWAR